MRVLAPVLIVLILVLGALIALRMIRTANRRKEEWRTLSNRANLAEQTISQISNEVKLAQSASISIDAFILDSIIEAYEIRLANPNNKEIAR